MMTTLPLFLVVHTLPSGCRVFACIDFSSKAKSFAMGSSIKRKKQIKTVSFCKVAWVLIVVIIAQVLYNVGLQSLAACGEHKIVPIWWHVGIILFGLCLCCWLAFQAVQADKKHFVRDTNVMWSLCQQLDRILFGTYLFI